LCWANIQIEKDVKEPRNVSQDWFIFCTSRKIVADANPCQQECHFSEVDWHSKQQFYGFFVVAEALKVAFLWQFLSHQQ
jgi:hypothetical protein